PTAWTGSRTLGGCGGGLLGLPGSTAGGMLPSRSLRPPPEAVRVCRARPGTLFCSARLPAGTLAMIARPDRGAGDHCPRFRRRERPVSGRVEDRAEAPPVVALSCTLPAPAHQCPLVRRAHV